MVTVQEAVTPSQLYSKNCRREQGPENAGGKEQVCTVSLCCAPGAEHQVELGDGILVRGMHRSARPRFITLHYL